MGVIQCGSFSGNTTTTLGWEPQWIMIKRTDSTGDWIVIDSARGCSVGGVDAVLYPNLSSAESTVNDYIDFTATGFISKNLTGTYIYTAIRRSNKPPTTGTQVYNADFRNATAGLPQYKSGFVTDMAIVMDRDGSGNVDTVDRLRGALRLLTYSTGAETSGSPNTKWDYMNGFGATTGSLYDRQLAYMFKRAPSVFDIVCYTGTGSATTVAHGLGVAPELMIVKARNSVQNWKVYHKTLTATQYLTLNNTDNVTGNIFAWNNTEPTNSVFTLGASSEINASAMTCVAYLFATKAGISKCGSYTGNGSSQTIDCGFTTGARFFMCKSTSTTGSWWVYDSTRGIVSGTDYGLQLNSTAAEVTSADAVDPASTGIIVNTETTCNINTNGVSYIYLAFA